MTMRLVERVQCPRGCGTVVGVSYGTDDIGRVFTIPDYCPCLRNERRRVLGLCRDCTNAVDGQVGSALRCNYCRAAHMVRIHKEQRRRDAIEHPPKSLTARGPKRTRCCTDCKGPLPSHKSSRRCKPCQVAARRAIVAGCSWSKTA